MIIFNQLAKELYEILHARYKNIKLFDEEGNKVPSADKGLADARRFYVDGMFLVSIMDNGENSAIKMYFDTGIDFEDVKELIDTLKALATSYNILISIKRSDKKIKLTDYANTEMLESIGDNTMKIFENMYGTSKGSYVNLNNGARLIIKENLAYVEDSSGERKEFENVEVAKEIAFHLHNGGSFHDQVCDQIIRLADSFAKLKEGKTWKDNRDNNGKNYRLANRQIDRKDKNKNKDNRLSGKDDTEELEESNSLPYEVHFKMNKTDKRLSVAEYKDKDTANKFVKSVRDDGGYAKLVTKKLDEDTMFNRELDQKTISKLDTDYKSIMGKRGTNPSKDAMSQNEKVTETHLSKAQLKKREEVATAIAKENPNMPMGKKMAIATATAKKSVKEEEMIEEGKDRKGEYNKNKDYSWKNDQKKKQSDKNKRFNDKDEELEESANSCKYICGDDEEFDSREEAIAHANKVHRDTGVFISVVKKNEIEEGKSFKKNDENQKDYSWKNDQKKKQSDKNARYDDKELDEAFDMEPTDPSKRGMFNGKTLEDLHSMLNNVKEKMKSAEKAGHKVPDELRSKFSQLEFAIRAKQHNKWGKVEENLEEGKIPTLDQIDQKHPSGSKEHFAALINKYTDHADKEHNYYLNRGNNTKSQKQRWEHHDDEMSKTNTHFFKHYGHLQNKDTDKTFNLGNYDTDHPERMAKNWLEENLDEAITKDVDAGSETISVLGGRTISKKSWDQLKLGHIDFYSHPEINTYFSRTTPLLIRVASVLGQIAPQIKSDTLSNLVANISDTISVEKNSKTKQEMIIFSSFVLKAAGIPITALKESVSNAEKELTEWVNSFVLESVPQKKSIDSLQDVKDYIKQFSDSDEAYAHMKTLTGIPKHVSSQFYDTYGHDDENKNDEGFSKKLSTREAFDRMYNEAKTGINEEIVSEAEYDYSNDNGAYYTQKDYDREDVYDSFVTDAKDNFDFLQFVKYDDRLLFWDQRETLEPDEKEVNLEELMGDLESYLQKEIEIDSEGAYTDADVSGIANEIYNETILPELIRAGYTVMGSSLNEEDENVLTREDILMPKNDGEQFKSEIKTGATDSELERLKLLAGLR